LALGFIGVDDPAFDIDVITNVKGGSTADIDLSVGIAK
jgi:hypothetical protein